MQIQMVRAGVYFSSVLDERPEHKADYGRRSPVGAHVWVGCSGCAPVKLAARLPVLALPNWRALQIMLHDPGGGARVGLVCMDCVLTIG